MAGIAHALLIHPEVDAWVSKRPELRRRIDWLLFELATRGEAGRPKGIVGPASRVRGVPEARWRRSGVGGFHYYAWWFPTDDGRRTTDAGPQTTEAPSVVVRAIRHHDNMQPLGAGDWDDYRPRGFADLRPLTEEQTRIVDSSAAIRLAVGYPGTGKTAALLFAAIREAASLPPGRTLLYVTLSRRLATLAQEILDGVRAPNGETTPRDRVRVAPLADLLAAWSGADGPSSADRPRPVPSEEDEERAFLRFAAGFAPRELAVWQDSPRALWAEVRAHVLGTALPFPLRELPASREPILDERSYRRIREPLIGGKAARAAWRVARLFVERRDLPSVQREAWLALQRLRAGALDRETADLGGVIVDELQDLTLLQIAVLAEAARRAGGKLGESGGGEPNGSGQSGRGEPSARPDASPYGRPHKAVRFVAAGDESQIVHPSGFDWGWCKDLLADRLGSQPEEVTLRAVQRSAAPLIEVTNRTALLYDELPREYRPRGSARADTTDAPNGEVVLATVRTDDRDLIGWLELLADTPHNAVIVSERDPTALAPAIGEERFRDLLFTPSQVKGLDRQYVVIWDASRALHSLRDEIAAARGKGQQPRFLVARTAIDELRVATSRATETLVFLDPPDVETDPLLADLGSLARRRSVAFLRDRLEERNADPRERAFGFLTDAEDLLEDDLDRGVRTLVRVEAALAELVDPDQRREPLERAVVVRRRAADTLIERGRYAEAAEQLERLAPACRELGLNARCAQYGVLARRYREAPPGDPRAVELLPDLFGAYVDALAALPPDDRVADATIARAWLQEALVVGDDDAALRSLFAATRRLAELVPARHAASVDLGVALADRLLDVGAWSEALALLSERSDPPPEKLARCHEGLRAWREAAEARLAAAQPAKALEDYRRAGAFGEAAELAVKLDQRELAQVLGLLAGLTGTLDRLGETDLGALAEDEARGLAERLRDAADLLARHRRERERSARRGGVPR